MLCLTTTGKTFFLSKLKSFRNNAILKIGDAVWSLTYSFSQVNLFWNENVYETRRSNEETFGKFEGRQKKLVMRKAEKIYFWKSFVCLNVDVLRKRGAS